MSWLLIILLFYFVWSLSGRISALEKQLKTNQVSGEAPKQPPVLNRQAVLPEKEENISLVPESRPFLQPTSEVREASDSNILARVGVAALVLGLGFFFKYSVDQGWINEWTRVILGLLVSGLMLILGLIWKKQYGTRADVLSGGGIALAFFCLYAGHNFYQLYGFGTAITLYLAVAVLAVAIAFTKDARPLASLGLAGAFCAPLFFGLKADQQTFIIGYLSLLSVASLILFFSKQWLEMPVLSLASATVVFTIWVLNFSQPQNNLDSWYFSSAMLIIYVLGAAWAFRRRALKNQLLPDSDQATAILSLLAGAQFFGFSVFLLNQNNFGIRPWAGLLGGVVFLMGYVLADRLEFKNLNYSLTFGAAFMLIASVFWQFDPNPEVIFTLVLSLFGFLAGAMQKREELRFWSVGMGFFAFGRALFLPYSPETQFLFNAKFGLSLLAIAEIYFFAFIFRNLEFSEQERKSSGALFVVSVLALWVSVSWDILNGFGTYGMENVRNLVMTLWWVLLACGSLSIGRMLNVYGLKRAALFLLGIGVIKAFLYDVWALELVYRVVAFVCLGVILLALSFVYNRDKNKITKLFE